MVEDTKILHGRSEAAEQIVAALNLPAATRSVTLSVDAEGFATVVAVFTPTEEQGEAIAKILKRFKLVEIE